MLDDVEKTLIKTAPTTYDIINITMSGNIGESRASLISTQFSIIKNPIRVVNEAIVIFPRTMKIFPIPVTRVNLPACFNIKINPFIAEVQKFSEVRAI